MGGEVLGEVFIYLFIYVMVFVEYLYVLGIVLVGNSLQ